MSLRDTIEEAVYQVGGTKETAAQYAKQMKEKSPHRQDYGYGMAGITLNNWEKMKALYLGVGPA